MTSIKDIERTVIEVLCGQALADHLGDIRDEERALWKLLGVEDVLTGWDWGKSVFENTKARLEAAGYSIPKYLQDSADMDSRDMDSREQVTDA